MRKFTKVLALILAAGSVVSAFAGCNQDFLGDNSGSSSSVGSTQVRPAADILTVDENGLQRLRKSGSGLRYYSSDTGFDGFMNDYYARHIRDDNVDMAIGTVQLGLGWTFQKEWEAIALSWFDSTASGVSGYDPMYNMSSGLDALYVSDYGCVSTIVNMPVALGESDEGNPGASHGWGFISGGQTGNWANECNEDADVTGWTINGESGKGTVKNGFWEYSFKGKENQSILYDAGTLDEEITYAPMVEIGFQIDDNQNGVFAEFGDIVLSFKMDNEDWVSISYNDYAINDVDAKEGIIRAWFPVYLHPAWDVEKKLTGLKLEIQPQEGESLDITAKMNYVRLQTDTRHTNNSTLYISGMEKYISFTGDVEMLSKNIDDIRKAMMFQIYALGGINGLIKTDYHWGKTTTAVGRRKFGTQGNSWYDVLMTGTVNLEANINYLISLECMAKIEALADELGIGQETTYITNPYPFDEGAQPIAWDFTPQQLLDMRQSVMTSIQKNVADGGLWNPETGRFAWAIYDAGSNGGAEGTAYDSGFTQFNLEMVMHEYCTEEQAESIMSWISGERIVEGDDSTGEDIYFYRFAPRINTKDDTINNTSIWQRDKFGLEIQNGGAAVHHSYYDLLARNTYYGADNSFARFKEMQAWYEDVHQAGGKGLSFYREYYTNLYIDSGDEQYKMAGGGSADSIGLDYEFYEAAIMFAVVPTAYFGLESTKYGQLSVTPNLPSSLEYMAMENLMFNNVRYDLFITNSSAVISGLRGGDSTDKTVKFSFRYEGSAPTVTVNNKTTTNFTFANGVVTVEVPLAQMNVEVK